MNALMLLMINDVNDDVINVHELRQIVKGLKNNKAVGNDGIPSEVYKFASERLLTMMSIIIIILESAVQGRKRVRTL